MDAISPLRIEEALSGRLIGRTIAYYAEIDSTNTEALRRAGQGAREGDVVVADCQHAGRGRLAGRRWQSPPGRNIYASIILRPPIEPRRASALTLVAGVAVAETLSRYCPGRVRIKWPNDVLVDGLKVAGILTEMRTEGPRISVVVVGIGINIHMGRQEFDDAFRDRATSLAAEATVPVSRESVLRDLLFGFETWYRRFLAEGFAGVREAWLAGAALSGRPVEIRDGESVQRGVVAGIDEGGCLLLGNGRGEMLTIMSGDLVELPEESRCRPGE